MYLEILGQFPVCSLCFILVLNILPAILTKPSYQFIELCKTSLALHTVLELFSPNTIYTEWLYKYELNSYQTLYVK